MKRKNILILIAIFVVFIIAIFLTFFDEKMSKNSNNGNNINSQDIVNYILNIQAYEATIQVEVKSNKNENKYIIKQEYKNGDFSSQEILEPANIAGVKITKKEKQLKLENTKLNLSSIFENYEYVSDNNLDLYTFIEEFKLDEKANWEENENQIIMRMKNNDNEKILYVDKNQNKPVKLEIKDINKNTDIYISYKEINIK